MREVVVVTIEMVGSNVSNNTNRWGEVVNIVQLKAADFQDEIIIILFGNLLGKTVTYIPGQANVKTSLFQ